MNTVTAPTIIPQRAPALVNLFQYREIKMIGPKDAPNPAQAKATKPRIVSFCSHAKSTIRRLDPWKHSNGRFVSFLKRL